MRFFKNILVIAIVCNLQCLNAKQVGAKQSSPNIQPQPRPSVQPKPQPQPTQPIYAPMPQEEYTQIFTMLQTTQPSPADHTMLMKIKNETERQIQTIATSPTKTISNLPSSSHQQANQGKLAIRRASMNVDPWSDRDRIWINENWNSLTQQEKMQLYNEKPEYIKLLIDMTPHDPLVQKIQQWLTKNRM